MTVPFEYPDSPHVRRHGPSGYADYESYRPWLRDDFSFRCVYCLMREQWGPFKGIYALDHFQPVTLRPDLTVEYDNLLYGCVSCNLYKSSRIILDPLVVLLSSTVSVTEDGGLVGATVEAKKLIESLGLNRPRLREFRALWIGIARLAAQFDPPLHHRILGYPAELPNLSDLRPPGGNRRPDGVAQSHYARRERGELASSY